MRILGVNIPFTSSVNDVVNEHKTERNENEILKTKIVERQLYRVSATVGKWRSALSQAENVHTPNRTPLIEIYKEVELDTHLTAVINSRTLAVTSQRFKVCNKDGSINEVLTDALDKDWLDRFIKGSIDSIFYGYTLWQFDEISDLKVGYLEAFPRQNVDPDRHLVKPYHYTTGGIPFDEEPYSNLIIFVGDREEKGLLNKCAPLLMFKKDAWANWSDFQELFGIPPRIGRTDVRNSVLRKNMDEALKNMGKLFYAVMDKDDSIELIQSTKGDSFNVFDKLIEGVNKEISKIVLGQTGTTDEKAFSGSSGVHERKEQQITRADVKFIERTINDELLPLLARNGWNIPEGAYFMYDKTEQVSKKDRFEMLVKLLPTFNIPAEYIKEEFNIEVQDRKLDLKETVQSTLEMFNDVNNLYKLDPYEVVSEKKKLKP